MFSLIPFEEIKLPGKLSVFVPVCDVQNFPVGKSVTTNHEPESLHGKGWKQYMRILFCRTWRKKKYSFNIYVAYTFPSVVFIY